MRNALLLLRNAQLSLQPKPGHAGAIIRKLPRLSRRYESNENCLTGRFVGARWHDTCRGHDAPQPSEQRRLTSFTKPLRTEALLAALTFTPSSEPPSVALAVAVVIGLPIVLWTYKCIMLVTFQRKIIYMHYVPANAHEEQLKDKKIPKALSCEEVAVQAEKGITLYGVLVRKHSTSSAHPKTVIFYMQGNAGTPLGRMPTFQRLLLGIRLTPGAPLPNDPLSESVILAIAPRSYWKSTRRGPSERGLMSDYEHSLAYACKRWPSSNIIIYGHSLGGAAAICLTARLRDNDAFRNVRGLVLENPFSSIPAMVKALYPQRWLPYHYLGPLAVDRWNAVGAMKRAQADPECLLYRLSRSMLLVLSKKDEIVPNSHGYAIFDAARRAPASADGKEGDEQRRVVVLPNALHENAWRERAWRAEVESYVRSIHEGPSDERIGDTVTVIDP